MRRHSPAHGTQALPHSSVYETCLLDHLLQANMTIRGSQQNNLKFFLFSPRQLCREACQEQDQSPSPQGSASLTQPALLNTAGTSVSGTPVFPYAALISQKTTTLNHPVHF